MKFARDFKQSLANEDFPAHWVEQAIPYGQLKKCLKKVQQELQDLGLDPETLRSLTDPENTSPVALKYRLQISNESNLVRPTLTVDVRLKDGIVIDASLTASSRRFLEKIATELPTDRPTAPAESTEDELTSDGAMDELPGHETGRAFQDNEGCETVEVPLFFDHQFFHMLQNDVNNIDAIQATEEKSMTEEIIQIRNEISQVAKPNKFSRTDLVRWRAIFELYLDAEVFFSTHEQQHGARSASAALSKLQWFQGEVQKRKLPQKFTLRESHVAFSRFLNLNASLLKNLQFQELNQTAVFKILKKFDKRTALGISKSFRTVVKPHGLMAGSIGKDVCAVLSQEIIPIVPQINDYLCPVCFAVAYRPIRLDCQHVFCIRCVIKLQRRREAHCPLCRADVVMKASANNLDEALGKYMRKYFAKEVKEKQRANEIERGIEDYGEAYTHRDCILM